VAQEPALRFAEQRARGHARGVGHGRPVDALHEPVAQALDETPLLLGQRGLLRTGEGRAAAAQRLGQGDRLPEVDEDAAEAALEELARAHEAEDALVLLPRPLQLADHGALLHHPLVGDGGGNEEEVAAAGGQEPLHVPAEEAELRGQRLAGARTPALDEELLGKPLSHQVGHVAAEHLLVERIVQRTAHEEGAAAAEQVAERPERHVLAGQDVGRHHVPPVEEPGQDEEVEVRAVAGHQHDRVAPGVVGHLLEAGHLDAREHPPEDRPDHHVEHRQDRGVHAGGDLAQQPLGLGPRRLGADRALAGVGFQGGPEPRIVEDRLHHPGHRMHGGTLHHLFLAVQVEEQGAAHLADDGGGALRAPLVHEATQVDGVSDLDLQVAVVEEEARHLGQVRGARGGAVGEVQEAARVARPLAPEERQGHEEHRAVVVPHAAHDLGQEIQLAAAGAQGVAAPQEPRAEPVAAQEQEERFARPHELVHVLPAELVLMGPLRGPAQQAAGAQAPQGDRDGPVERTVMVEGHAVGEAREPQPLATEEPVEQEVVEPARVAHHVDQRALGLEGAQALDGLGLQVQVTEEAAAEPAEEEVEAGRHRRVGIGERLRGRVDSRRRDGRLHSARGYHGRGGAATPGLHRCARSARSPRPAWGVDGAS